MTVLPATKDEWRSRLLDARRAVPPEVRATEAVALAGFARELVGAGQTVCGYVPVGTEPGSVQMLDSLRDAGVQVLLPVVVGYAPLDWARYDGSLQPGPHRLLEPTGSRLGPQVIGTAALILVPALAVDSTGIRLGRGAGHYDRSLAMAAPDAVVAGVVRDQEFLPHLPFEPHDIRMTAVLTPGRGMIDVSSP